LLVSDYDVGDVLYQLCDHAMAVTGTTGAGILLEDVDGRLRYAVASDPMTSELEGIQLELGEGPCMLAHSSGEPVLIPELRAEDRFPAMVPRTLDKGMRAVFTLPLLHSGSSIGILDLYRNEPGPLDPEQSEAAALMADMATTAVLNRRHYESTVDRTQRLQEALDARILMEQAKGRVSADVGVGMQRAEELIHDFARALERPTGTVVREIAAGRLTLPGDGDVQRSSAGP
jgi:GAF domain-containing protein